MRGYRSRFCPSLVTAVLALFLAFAPTAHAKVDFTDIWETEGGTEPGWGVNFAHTGDFIFATFFIYGPNGAPVWYTAQLLRTTGDTFSGGVYVTSGTWFGAPVFIPVPPGNVVAVGDATFTATNNHRGTFHYRVDTVAVNKNIERFTTTSFSVADIYLGGSAGTVAGSTCATGTTGSFVQTMQFRVTQTAASVLRIEFSGADSTNRGQLLCAMQGPATQRGKLLEMSGAGYQCTGGAAKTADVASIRLLDDGIEAHWTSSLGGTCVEQGRLAGVKQ